MSAKAFHYFCYAPTDFPPPVRTKTCRAPGPAARRRREACKDWNDGELLSNSKMIQQERFSTLTILLHSNTVRGEGNLGGPGLVISKGKNSKESEGD